MSSRTYPKAKIVVLQNRVLAANKEAEIQAEFEAVVAARDIDPDDQPALDRARNYAVAKVAKSITFEAPGQRRHDLSNADFAATDRIFRNACVKAGIPPTARQASKWRQGRGLARTHREF